MSRAKIAPPSSAPPSAPMMRIEGALRRDGRAAAPPSRVRQIAPARTRAVTIFDSRAARATASRAIGKGSGASTGSKPPASAAASVTKLCAPGGQQMRTFSPWPRSKPAAARDRPRPADRDRRSLFPSARRHDGRRKPARRGAAAPRRRGARRSRNASVDGRARRRLSAKRATPAVMDFASTSCRASVRTSAQHSAAAASDGRDSVECAIHCSEAWNKGTT